MSNELDTDIWFSIVAGSLLFFVLCAFIVAFTILYIRRKNQHIVEKRELQIQFNQTFLQAKLEIKEQTLQHISTELHDNLGQIASLIKIHLNTIQLDDSAKSKEKIANTKELVVQLIGDLKNLSLSLNSDQIGTMGLVSALQIELAKLKKLDQLEVKMKVDGEMPALDNGKTIILYRMSQEIINNILKHSKAKELIISLKIVNNLLILVFCDDGIGFDIDDITRNGSGLNNLHNRARLVSGTLQIESSVGTGTTISIEMPL